MSSDVKNEGSDVLCQTPSSEEEARPSRHATFASGQNLPHRDSHTTSPAQPMLSRRPSLSSASHRTERFFSRRNPRWRRQPPVDSVIPLATDDDGAPAPRGATVTVDTQKILESVWPRNRPATKMPFPEFDSLDAYFVPGETAQHLWGKEVERLLEIVQHPEKALKFPSQEFFKQGSEEGYRDLSRLSQRILTALSLCLLDNECINVEHCIQLSSREKLSKLIEQARRGQSTSEVGDCELDPAKEKEAEENLDAIFCLIDYISAVLARLISGTATGDYWLVNILGVLTKRVTKLKILMLDMHTSTTIAVMAGEVAVDKSRPSGGLDQSLLDDEEDCEEVQRIINANTKEGLTSAEEAEVASYCVNQNKFRLGVNSVFRYILLSLRFLDRSGLSATEYEICALVYETGFEGFKALLFQDRDMEYSATSELDTVNTAHSAFSILNQAVTNVKVSPGATHGGRLVTNVQWAYADSQNTHPTAGEVKSVDLTRCQKLDISLSSMEDIITVMVPLVITSPVVVANFTNFRTMMALTGEVKDIVRPFAEGQFSAFFRMYTNDFQTNRRRGVLQLSDALSRGLFSRCSLMTGAQDMVDLPVAYASARESDVAPQVGLPTYRPTDREPEKFRQLRNLTWEMDAWVIDENSVTVEHALYVWGVLAVAAVLAGGGLAIGFTVGSRINGVDPFNLATYTWVLAAFVILVCKSVQVDEWRWSDFLRRKVRCRSVSELQAVTGINEQLIMAKLLHDERGGSVLKTRGPYNMVFENRGAEGDIDGFSIDRPLSTRSMLLSGLILLKVVTPQGHALVCLDARRGTDLKVVEHQGMDSKEHLVCEDVTRLSYRPKQSSDLGGSYHRPAKLQLTRSKNLKWKRVQGVYNVMDAVFV